MTVRIALLSDTHLDARTMGRSRFDEGEAAFERWTAEAIRRKVDLACFLGDLCDPDSGPVVIRCIAVALRAAQCLSDAGIPSVWVAGNHDVDASGHGTTTLRPIESLVWSSPSVFVAEQPRSWRLARVVVHALPFVEPSRAYDVEEHVRKIEIPEGGERLPQVVLSHMTSIPGVEKGSESEEMARGRAIELPRKAIGDRLGPRVSIFQGHFHHRQLFAPDDGAPPVQIVGSSARFRFDEETHDPGFLIAEVE